MDQKTSLNAYFAGYASRLSDVLASSDWTNVTTLANDMLDAWSNGNQVFFCGNGGSAGNAIHLANDFIYGVAKKTGGGVRAVSLSANAAVLTCLANDTGYDNIYSEQLAVLANEGDILIALSGSGNSPNILRALEQAKSMKIKSYAILGFDGGKAKSLADIPIHFTVNDMQISEDLQLIVGHMLMQYLYENRESVN
jgi:D-sedoheptulose 7-phosphate isomerase